MKVVIDTNVLIEGFKDDYSYERRIIDSICNGEIEAFANHGTLAENKLLLKQLITNPEYLQVMNNLFAQINTVSNIKPLDVVLDKEDNKILASAVASQADYLITNDNDLLGLKKYQNIKITTPAGFWTNYIDDKDNLWQQWINYVNKQ